MTTAQKQLFRFAPTDKFDHLLSRNCAWSERMNVSRPSLFPTNGQGQSPQVLWIGCSDSRVSDSCLDLLPGEVFVHRNIANVLPNNDLSSLAVLQYAVQVLKVKHIVVCGHYDCGGVHASLGNKKLGLIDNWLKSIRDVKARHKKELDAIEDPTLKANRLSELNCIAQVYNLLHNDIVMEAVQEGELKVHGVMYDVATGLLKEVEIPEDADNQQYYIA